MDSNQHPQQQQQQQPQAQSQPPPPPPPQQQQQQPPPPPPQQQQQPPQPQQLYPQQQQMYAPPPHHVGPPQPGYPPPPQANAYHQQPPRYPPQYSPHYGGYHNYYPPPPPHGTQPPPPHGPQPQPHHVPVPPQPQMPHQPPQHAPQALPPQPSPQHGHPPPPPQQQMIHHAPQQPQQQLYPQQQQMYAPPPHHVGPPQAGYPPPPPQANAYHQQPPRYPPHYSPHYGGYHNYYPPPPPHGPQPPPPHGPQAQPHHGPVPPQPQMPHQTPQHGPVPPQHGPVPPQSQMPHQSPQHPPQALPPQPSPQHGHPPPPPPQQQMIHHGPQPPQPQQLYPQQQQMYAPPPHHVGPPQAGYPPPPPQANAYHQQPPRYPPQYSPHYGGYHNYYPPPPPHGPQPQPHHGPVPPQPQMPHQPPQHAPQALPPQPSPQLGHPPPPPQQQMIHHAPQPPQPPPQQPIQPIPPQIQAQPQPPPQVQHHHPPPTPSRNSTPISVNVTFPKNSVEATKPTPIKKRKITSKDLNDVEAWRLLMCLKSGLLAESSWAIDVLGILLNDDATLMYFGLQHMPGLLESVLEHFKCCLNELFDDMVSDTTLKPVLVEDQEDQSCELVFKTVGYSHWQEGNGEDTSHIQVHFEPNNFMETSKRCICLSTILRNLSFVPGNEVEMSKHAGLLLVLGRLLLRDSGDVVPNETDSSPNEKHLLNSLREDTLVIIANISSSLDLSPYNDKINLSLLDGLLHWASCSSSYALDLFPEPSMCSPQRLALESLAKLSIIEGNVDLILATPPWSRIEKLFEVLIRLLNINEDQTIREFSLVLLSNLTSADSGIARKVALTGAAIPRLLSFLETSITDPETFSTTQDMLRRAAITLKCLSQLVDNHSLFGQHQQRLLDLAMSRKLDPEVVPIIADVIFEISLSD